MERIYYMSLYGYHVIITFFHKVRKIEEKNCKVSDYSRFDWLSKHIVNYFMYE